MEQGMGNIMEEYRRQFALNGSLEGRLEEYSKIIRDRDNEIEMLQAMLTEANSYRSNLDAQVNELSELQQSIAALQQQVEAASYIGANRISQVSVPVSVEEQLGQLKIQYTYLQTQLSDLQQQTIELNNRNLVLQQQTSRIGELESLLENAEAEIANLNSRLT